MIKDINCWMSALKAKVSAMAGERKLRPSKTRYACSWAVGAKIGVGSNATEARHGQNSCNSAGLSRAT